MDFNRPVLKVSSQNSEFRRLEEKRPSFVVSAAHDVSCIKSEEPVPNPPRNGEGARFLPYEINVLILTHLSILGGNERG
jgi:hypothetical protein